MGGGVVGGLKKGAKSVDDGVEKVGKEKYVEKTSGRVALLHAVNSANWQLDYSGGANLGRGNQLPTDIEDETSCFYTLTKDCSLSAADQLMLAINLIPLPQKYVVFPVTIAVTYYTSIGELDNAAMYLMFYGLAEGGGVLIKEAARTGYSLIRLGKKKVADLVITREFSQVIKDGITQQGMNTLFQKQLSSKCVEYLIPDGAAGNIFVKINQYTSESLVKNEVLVGRLIKEGNSNTFLATSYSRGIKNIISSHENLTAQELKHIVQEVSGAGKVWKTFLDDAFTLQKRAEVISSGLPSQFPNLTIDELTAIKVYTSNELRGGSYIYQTLNTELRAGSLSAYNSGLNDLVNNALSKLPAHNGNVFRGVYGAEANLAKTWKVGDEVPFKDFKSSSTNKQVAAYDFAERYNSDVFYEIIGANGRNVCGISCVPNEMEVLLKSNLKFKVKEIQPNHMVYDKNFEFQKPFTRIVLEITQ